MSPTIDTLPTEILLLIIPYLSARDTLALCSSSRQLHNNEEVLHSPAYWSGLTKSTFRVPNHPVVENDGKRWMLLYRRMKTQTEIYSWGNNDKGCLGGGTHIRGALMRRGRPVAAPHVSMNADPPYVTWPRQTKMGSHSVVADLQSGGWSNTILDSKGSLFTIGVLDGLAIPSPPSPVPHRLQYPPGFPNPVERYDSHTAIKQFSSGRSHVLGLSDSGRIWSWDDTGRPGLHVKFLSVDLLDRAGGAAENRKGLVRKVMAGWDRSTAYIYGTGIVVWEPSNNAELQGQSDQSTGDGMLVLEQWIVPKSGFLKSAQPERQSREDKGAENEASIVGEVVSWAVMEFYILFVTHLGKLYASRIPREGEDNPHTIVLMSNNPTNSDPPDPGHEILDVQGSFRSFAIFKRNGEVLTGHQTDIYSKWMSHFHTHEADTRLPKLTRIPALQNSGVISMAFGDWHYHALHADGSISSYGMENQFCGALGLGGNGIEVLRGVVGMDWNRDGQLLQQCYTTGRRVCFEEEKKMWLDHLKLGDHDRAEAERRVLQCLHEEEVRAEVSEWFEQKLRAWEDVDGEASKESAYGNDDAADDGLPAYFALNVASAGWHSAALMLVNREKAERNKKRYRAAFSRFQTRDEPTDASLPDDEDPWKPRWVWEDDTFPRLRLRSGEVMAGQVPVMDWQSPEWQEVEEVPI